MRRVRIAMAQINPIVGDFNANIAKIVEYAEKGTEQGADIVLFPELAVCGYPPEDLLLQAGFLDSAGTAVDKIARQTAKLSSIIIVGFPERDNDTYNSAAIIHRGRILDTYRKLFLPNYGVFDEKRYFLEGERVTVYDTPNFRFGINICEDIWHAEGPVMLQALFGECEVILNINSSPYHVGKRAMREQMISTRSADNTVAIAYLNSVGGQDELVFDGQSFAVDAEGFLIARAAAFTEELLIVDFNLENICRQRLQDPRRRNRKSSFSECENSGVKVIEIPFFQSEDKPEIIMTVKDTPAPLEEVWLALKTGLYDYLHKNGFKSVVLGLSGGIDSALVAAIAEDAFGADKVHTVYMPAKFSTQQSFDDAEKLAKNLGVNFQVIEIEPLYEEYLKHLKPIFKARKFDTTEENLQSRIRGNIIMALSNKFGHLVLATGNKSEMSVGYATLYGDMCGGFAVLKDVPKTLVWALARWFNEHRGKELIPHSIIERPPTAELRENQLDTDSLPPYDVLDRILELYIEEEMSAEEIVSQTPFDEVLVRKVAKMVDTAEYKRRQAAPGIKITARAFGKERRMPITKR